MLVPGVKKKKPQLPRSSFYHFISFIPRHFTYSSPSLPNYSYVSRRCTVTLYLYHRLFIPSTARTEHPAIFYMRHKLAPIMLFSSLIVNIRLQNHQKGSKTNQKCCVMAQAVTRHPFTAAALYRLRLVHVRYLVGNGTGV